MQTGANLGPYRIVEQIGRGGMATVYKAYQAGLARYVAIKVLPSFFAEEPSFRERFQQEAIAVAKLRHPNILVVFDYGEEGGITYLVSEYVEGGTLSGRVGSPLSLSYTTEVLGPVASALDFAHGRGILHRDIKPSNILLNQDGAPVLSDFGLAKMMGSMPRLTMTGMTVGTPEYMAPEQGEGDVIGPSADNYSLAVVAYEMLTGRVPFSAETPLAVLLAHLHKPLPMPRTVNPAISEALEAVLLKGLAKAPEDRYPTASQFVHALAATDHETTQAQQPMIVTTKKLPLAQPNTEVAIARAGAAELSSADESTAGTVKTVPSTAPAPSRSATPGGFLTPVRLAALVAVLVLLAVVAVVAMHGGTSGASNATSTASPPSTTTTAIRIVAGTKRPGSLTVTPLTIVPPGTKAKASAVATLPPAFVAVTKTPAPQAVVAAGPEWTNIGSPPGLFVSQRIVELRDGRVLFAGGNDVNGAPTADVAIYDPSTKAWSSVAPMRTPRAAFIAVLLADGRVLAVGGESASVLITSAEIYDPATDTWKLTASVPESRRYETATLLNNGNVLLAGGEDAKFNPLATADIYQPASGTWKKIAAPSFSEHTATLLADGRVLLIGGGIAELFDPARGTWIATAPPLANRSGHVATLLRNGKVLAAGGEDYPNSRVLASAEIYDPKANSWAMTASMATTRYQANALLLADGRVLVSGGESAGTTPLQTAELYDPASGTWHRAGAMPEARAQHAGVTLKNGDGLLAAGVGVQGVLGDAVLFAPNSVRALDIAVAPVPRPARVAGDGRRYFPITKHTLAGSFLAYWNLHDGALLLGQPITQPFTQGGVTLQYLERGLLQQTGATMSLAPVGQQLAAAHHFPKRDYRVISLFARYYAAHGGEKFFGKPLSDLDWEANGDHTGHQYQVQWFEKERLEYHPTLPAHFRVLPGLTGKEALELALAV